MGCLLGFSANAQVEGEIIIEGKITSVADGKGIRARIRYKSLPTGGITGSFQDSTYSFSIFGSSRYEIVAELQGYIPAVAIVDPANSNGTGKVVRDLRLTPKGQTIRLAHLNFELGKSKIDPASFEELDELVLLMKENPKLVIQLEGHTDRAGNASANMKLSQERVDEVKDYLTDKSIGKARVKTKAFGGTRPVSRGDAEEDRNLNRRVELRILSE